MLYFKEEICPDTINQIEYIISEFYQNWNDAHEDIKCHCIGISKCSKQRVDIKFDVATDISEFLIRSFVGMENIKKIIVT